jgi:hypothetical protein
LIRLDGGGVIGVGGDELLQLVEGGGVAHGYGGAEVAVVQGRSAAARKAGTRLRVGSVGG